MGLSLPSKSAEPSPKTASSLVCTVAVASLQHRVHCTVVLVQSKACEKQPEIPRNIAGNEGPCLFVGNFIPESQIFVCYKMVHAWWHPRLGVSLDAKPLTPCLAISYTVHSKHILQRVGWHHQIFQQHAERHPREGQGMPSP